MSSPDAAWPPALAAFLQSRLNATAHADLEHRVTALDGASRDTLVSLWQELQAASTKAAESWARQLPAAAAELAPEELCAWTDVGVALAARSATVALRYFADALEILRALAPGRRAAVLQQALEQADANYSVVLDFLRAAPGAAEHLPAADFSGWAEIGTMLTAHDAILGVEFFRISPPVLALIGMPALPLWVELGMRLVIPNQFGKPDYLRPIEFFRRSPEFLAAVTPEPLRIDFLRLGVLLATAAPPAALDYLRQAPTQLAAIGAVTERALVLEQALRIGAVHAGLVPDYLVHAADVLALVEHAADGFRAWVNRGLELAGESTERALAYFSRRSRSGQEEPDRLGGGVALPEVQRMLTLFAEALTGRPVRIRPESEREADATPIAGLVFLPDRVHRFPVPDDNFRLFKAATLHEAGHLEFGSYDLDLGQAHELISTLRTRYGRSHPVTNATAYFDLFPDPRWARRLWEIIEDARIDDHLRRAYPGARRDLDRIIELELAARPALTGLPPRAALEEALLQLSVSDTTEPPIELAEVVSRAYDYLLTVKTPAASALDALATHATLYPFLEDWLERQSEVAGDADPLGVGADDTAGRSGDGQGTRLSPAEDLAHRGPMRPQWITEESMSRQPAGGSGYAAPPSTAPAPRDPTGVDSPQLGADSAGEDAPPVPARGRNAADVPAAAAAFRYDEWDQDAQEYRPGWVQLREIAVLPEVSDFVAATLARYGSMLALLRRHFQALRPERLRRIRRQDAGDEIDLDALIEARVDRRAGHSPEERIYIRTEKRERDLAVAFLVDLSGSTSQNVGRTGRRVIDLEREALVLLAEALHAVGDRFAIYGFSGNTRAGAEFFVVKEFADRLDAGLLGRLGGRIAALKPMAQNRDGAAIRHAAAKLKRQSARTRLLILLSDGKPLDADYVGAYAFADTRAALRECRVQGIHPYCITIDPQAGAYLAQMYGDVSYTIVDQIETLPERLPRIYRRLTA